MELYETIFQALNYTDYGFGVFAERNHSTEVSKNENNFQGKYILLRKSKACMLQRSNLFLEFILVLLFSKFDENI